MKAETMGDKTGVDWVAKTTSRSRPESPCPLLKLSDQEIRWIKEVVQSRG
ncbi:MAG: hypothetical protein GY696_00575 [Gammaproteobacteria bacterium]|nr:hypothetical protein [Gammaproteobacteria bacterium]